MSHPLLQTTGYYCVLWVSVQTGWAPQLRERGTDFPRLHGMPELGPHLQIPGSVCLSHSSCFPFLWGHIPLPAGNREAAEGSQGCSGLGGREGGGAEPGPGLPGSWGGALLLAETRGPARAGEGPGCVFLPCRGWLFCLPGWTCRVCVG